MVRPGCEAVSIVVRAQKRDGLCHYQELPIRRGQFMLLIIAFRTSCQLEITSVLLSLETYTLALLVTCINILCLPPFCCR